MSLFLPKIHTFYWQYFQVQSYLYRLFYYPSARLYVIATGGYNNVHYAPQSPWYVVIKA